MKHLAALALVLLAAPSWAINKCTDAAGKVSYQEVACPQQGGKVVLHNTAPMAPSALDVERAKLYQEIEDGMRQLNATAEACGPKAALKPSVGMAESDFLCTRVGLFGVQKVNRTTTAGGVHKQYVMRDGIRSARYVYVENGKITAVQQ